MSLTHSDSGLGESSVMLLLLSLCGQGGAESRAILKANPPSVQKYKLEQVPTNLTRPTGSHRRET